MVISIAVLSDLCEKADLKKTLIPVVAQVTNNSEKYYKAIIEGKNNEISRLEKQVAFMEKMLDK